MVLPNFVYRVSEITASYFIINDKLILKSIRREKSQNSQSTLESEQHCMTDNTQLHIQLQGYGDQDRVRPRGNNSMEHNRHIKINPYEYVQLIIKKGVKVIKEIQKWINEKWCEIAVYLCKKNNKSNPS